MGRAHRQRASSFAYLLARDDRRPHETRAVERE